MKILLPRYGAAVMAVMGVVLTIALVGCGPQPEKGVVVKGKVFHEGKPLYMEGADVGVGWAEVALVPNDGDRPTEYGWLESDGSFLFKGQENGIQPGVYKLAAYLREEGPESDSLEGKFSAENTPHTVTIEAELVGKEQDLGVIELGKTE